MARQSTLTLVIEAKNQAKRVLAGVTRQVRGFADDVRGNFGRIRRAGRLAMSGLRLAAQGAAVGFTAAAGAILAFTKSIVGVASQVEQAQIRFKALFEDAEEGERAFRRLRRAAERLPQTFENVLQAGTSLAVISDDAEELETRLMQAAEISARFGIPLEETASNMIRFFTAGANSADLFRERGVLAALGVQAGMQTTVAESTRLWNQFFERIERQGTSATDDLAESFQGITSMLEDLWFEFRLRVSRAGIFDALKESFDEFRVAFEDFIDEGGAEQFARVFVRALAQMVGAIQAFVNVVVEANSFVRDTFVGRIFGLERSARGRLAEAQGRLGRLQDIAADMERGATRGGVAPRLAAEGVAPDAGLGAVRDEIERLQSRIDQPGGLAEQLGDSTSLMTTFNETLDDLQETLREGADAARDRSAAESEGGEGGGRRRRGGGGGLSDEDRKAVDEFLAGGQQGMQVFDRPDAQRRPGEGQTVRFDFPLQLPPNLDEVTAPEVDTSGLIEARTAWEEIGAAIRDATENQRVMEQVMADMISGVIRGFTNAISAAFEAAVTGSQSMGEAFKSAMLNAVASVAEGMAQFYAAKAVAALGEGLLGNPAGFAAAAKFTAAAAAFGALAGVLRGVASGGGAGAGVSARAGQQADRAGEARQPPATVIIRGGLLNMNDPRQRREFSEALENLTSRRVIIEGA